MAAIDKAALALTQCWNCAGCNRLEDENFRGEVMLTRRQLEDATKCKGRCFQCHRKYCQEQIAQTALVYRAMLEKAKVQFDKYAKIYGSIGAVAISEELAAMLKEGSE